MPRKANGEGTFDVLPSGKTRLRVTVDVDDIPVRKAFVGRNKTECRRLRDEWLQSENKVAVEKVQTLQQWSVHWMEFYCKPNVAYATHTQYQMYLDNHILPFKLGKVTLGDMKLTDVRPAHIARLYADACNKAGQPLSRSAVNKFRVILSGVFKTAIDNCLCQRNPAAGVKLPEREKAPIVIYTTSQIQKVIDALESSMAGAYIAIMLHTGLRPGEFLGLEWKDVDELNQRIYVKQSLKATAQGKQVTPGTKTKRNRVVPYGDALQPHLDRIPRHGDFVVARQRNGEYTHHTHDSFKVVFDGFFAELNAALETPLPRTTPHKCRHTFATYLLQGGADIRYVQELLGHSTITTTEIYTQVDVDALRDNIVKLTY
ncbi:MAG: site-specific integrase [Oscillospiraceae bacterium]|nr:site-specific integrase [Oscillospiraceae bacterium]